MDTNSNLGRHFLDTNCALRASGPGKRATTMQSSNQGLPIDQPRSGRELQLVHIAHAFLKNASVNPRDCDIHLEISETADKTAPRVVLETPVDSEYCSARQNIQGKLKQHGFRLDVEHGGELFSPLGVSVLGLPFEDFEHARGSPQVATLWEIHPAIVNIL